MRLQVCVNIEIYWPTFRYFKFTQVFWTSYFVTTYMCFPQSEPQRCSPLDDLSGSSDHLFKHTCSKYWSAWGLAYTGQNMMNLFHLLLLQHTQIPPPFSFSSIVPILPVQTRHVWPYQDVPINDIGHFQYARRFLHTPFQAITPLSSKKTIFCILSP